MFPAASPEAKIPASTGSRVEQAAALAVVLLYCIVQIVLFATHVPWIDEAQAWLWATRLSKPIEFLIIPGEGHPPLWYWVLRPLSLFLDFNQARYVSLGIAIANAFLLWRVIGRDVSILALMLCSFVLLQFWGYHFRPYNIVFSCILLTLLLDRQNRPVAATWILAVACGFHFFSGLLFAFWLVYQRTRGTAFLALLGPSLLALSFGAMAILSGLGNTTVGPSAPDLLTGTLQNLSWIGMVSQVRGLWLALATLVCVVIAFRKRPIILATVLALLVAFAVATAAIYGKFPWHSAFMTMLCFMAVMVVGLQGRRWFLLLLLLPQAAFGITGVAYRFEKSINSSDIYAAIAADAGPGFIPSAQLVAWPDLAGVTMSAVQDVTIINGNGGGMLGPVDWREHDMSAIDPAMATRPTPYWLVCNATCPTVLDYLQARGRTQTLLAETVNTDNGQLLGYRID